MNPRFKHHLKVVAVVHVIAVAALIVLSSGSTFFKKEEELVVPVEFRVDVSRVETPSPEPDPEPAIPDPEPVVPEPDPVIPEPDPKPERREIKRSTRRVSRTRESSKPNPLSDEEIRRLLSQGAKPSDVTSIPDEEARCFDVVRRTLYRAWTQPGSAEARGAEAEAAIRLGAGGTVLERRLVKRSGNATVDQSVQDALDAVSRIDGLTAGFIERHESITISFRVE